ncbi:MAG: Wzy polymerase domain-containing protein [Aeromonas sp.]
MHIIHQRLFWGLSCLYWWAGMHFFMHNPGGAGLYLPFNIVGWLFIGPLLATGLWQLSHTGVAVNSNVVLTFALGVALLCLPLLYPQFALTLQAIPRLLGLIVGSVYLYSLYQWQFKRRERLALFYILFGAIAVEAGLGLTQYFLLTPGNWLGYNTLANRPYGIFQQPNVMASFLATGIAITLWLEHQDRRHGWLAYARAAVLASCALLLWVLQSRVGLLGALLVVVLQAPLLYRRQRLARVFATLALGIALALWAQTEVASVQRGTQIYQQVGMRSVYWRYALELISQAPGLGWGYGSFESTFLSQYMAQKTVNPSWVQIEYNLNHPHNELLYWLFEGGVAALVGLLLLLGGWLRRLTQTYWQTACASASLCAPLLLHTQTEYVFYHSIASWWLLLTLVYLTDAHIGLPKRVRLAGSQLTVKYNYARAGWLGQLTPTLSSACRISSLVLVLLSSSFMGTALHTAYLVNKFERGGYKDAQLLRHIINPLAWQARVEFHLHTRQLSAALAKHQPQALRAYVAWAQRYVAYMPRAAIYANMILALKALAKPHEAQQIKAQALALYPQDKRLLAL